MQTISKLSANHRIYRPIIKEFLKLKEVKRADLMDDNGNLSIRLTNNRTGKALKCFFFPIKQALKIDIKGSPGANDFDYDLMDLDDPEIQVMAGIKKAEAYFK
jgi:hypothetical protein